MTIVQDTIIAKRVFKATKRNGKGIVVAEAMLHKLQGNQAPYFSITTDNGCDHESILSAMPHLKPLTDIHLSDDKGAPMHAVANAAYHLKEKKDEALANHLRIPIDAAREIISDFLWVNEDMLKEQREHFQFQYLTWKKEVVDKMPPEVYVSGAIPRLYQTGKPASVETVVTGILDAARVMRAFFGWKRTDQFNRVSVPASETPGTISGTIPYPDAPHASVWFKNYDPDMLRRFTAKELAELQRFTSNHSATHLRMNAIRNWDAKTAREYGETAKRLTDMVTKRLEKAPDVTGRPAKMYIEDVIDSCFRTCWQRQADAALEMLQGEDDELEVEYTDDDPLIMINGETIIIEECRTGGYLPTADCGGRSYTLAADSDDAGEANVQYWTDMVQNDKREFACMVGEETLLKWALGEAAGPGSVKVYSLREWLELTRLHPEEQWASYDGEERLALLNEQACDELGIDYQDQGDGWSKAVAYQC